MRLTFRQGIARYQTDIYGTPTFLRKSVSPDGFVDLIVSPDPTIVVFAHKAATYIVEESRTVAGAWGPFPASGPTKYLYWDINLLDASLTRGFTALLPIVGTEKPVEPAIDQHWFDKTNHQMKVWNGTKWIEKLRVFAASYSSGAILHPMPLGTQAGENGHFEAGNLVLDTFQKPLRQSDGTFVTSASELSIINAATKKVKFEAEIYSGLAEEYIAQFSFVQSRPGRRIILARSDDWKSRISGIVTEDLHQNEVGNVVTDGLVRFEQWNWAPETIGKPIFCGPTGEVTLIPPTIGVHQIAGYVYDKDSVFINVKQAVILDDLSPLSPVDNTQPMLAPVASFTATPAVGTVPLTVTFNSTSLHNPTLIEWDFFGTGEVDAVGESVSFTYRDAGTYSVRLRASNIFGQDEEVKTGVIKVNPTSAPNLQTNLGIQLSGPLQVETSQEFAISVIVSNDGNLHSTEVARIIEIDDVVGVPVTISSSPSGSIINHVGTKTILALPVISMLGTGEYRSTSFNLTAPSVIGPFRVIANVQSPETDSTMADNSAELLIRVK